MSEEKKKYRYVYIGKVVESEGETKDGKKFKSKRIVLGNRKDKEGKHIPPVKLSKDQKAKLLDIILEKDLYTFKYQGKADFIKAYVAVKREDIEGADSEDDDI